MTQLTLEDILGPRTPKLEADIEDARHLATMAAVTMGKRVGANWVAMDANGTWYGFQREPSAYVSCGSWGDVEADHQLLPVPVIALIDWKLTLAEVIY